MKKINIIILILIAAGYLVDQFKQNYKIVERNKIYDRYLGRDIH